MSLKVFTTTRHIRRWQHLVGLYKPKTVRSHKLLSRRGERRRVRRELQVPADTE